MKKILFITAFVVLFFIPINASADIIINEIMYDLEDGSDSGREWVEIFNNSDISVDLTDWKFYENETNHGLTMIQGDINLPQNGYAVIANKPDKFLIDNPSYSGILFDSTFSLSNSGENLALKDSNLVIIDELTYDSSWGANGDGSSLQRKNPNENSNEATNWEIGNPTPGTLNTFLTEVKPEQELTDETPPIIAGNNPPIANAGDNIIGFIDQEIKFDGTKSSDPDKDELFYSWNMGDGKLIEKPKFTYKYLYAGTYLVSLMIYDGRNYAWDTITIKIQSQQITINEFIPNPVGTDEENEWIEIYNDSDSIVDISEWQLDDIDGGSKPFVFPENSLIAPKSYVVFPRQITKIALNNDKDKVRLLLPEGIVFQEISYENPKQGQSSARTNEGFIWSPPTPGMANIVNPPQGIGELDNEKQIVYQGQIKSETTKQPSENYSWYYQEPEKEIEGGYIKEDKLAGAFPLSQQGEIKGIQEEIYSNGDFWNQNNLNLILMIIIVILAGSIIGLIFTKFLRRPA